MSAEPAMNIDYGSIQRVFQARDEKNAREEARMKAETGVIQRSPGRSSQTGSKRAAQGAGLRAHSKTIQMPEQQRRTRLEDAPEQDEFRPQRRNVETGRPSQRSTKKDTKGTSRGGKRVKTQENCNIKMAGGIGAAIAGLGGAFMLVLNAILPSAPAQAPAGDIIQRAQDETKAIVYQAESEDFSNGIIRAQGEEYAIEYEGDIDSTVEVPLDTVDETIAPEETEAPYVPIEHVSDNVIEAMKGFEGLYLETYTCPGGSLTIGYGHTAGVYEGQTITLQEAKDLLREDLASREAHVKNYAEACGVQLTQGQFDALVDFTFNLGVGAFDRSGLVEMIGEGDIDGAAERMREYVWAKDPETGEKVKLGGLVTRRETEVEWLYS